jgi:lysophospholipase L1-like esterase
MSGSICIFGDSLTKGVVFDSVLKKYTLLKNCFANLIKNSANVAVKNYSKFGSTVSKGMEMLYRHQDELKNYDYIALEFGGNDCDYNWAEVSAAPDQPHQPKTPVSLFIQKYTEMINVVRRGGSRPVLLSLPPIDAKRYFAWISRGLNADNILRWLGDVEHIYRWHEMYNLAVCRLAKDSGVPLIDISSVFLGTKGYQKLLCEDGIHPNEEGHKLISRTIESTIRQYQNAYAS